MTLRNSFLSVFLLLCQMVLAQNDTIALKDVIVSDKQLSRFSETKSITKLNDSVIAKNGSSLTSLLKFNSNIYFKENGLGMVSSPAFRGTTAQQTAVIWNGININSQINGQTDFNILNSFNYNDIVIRAGGGSSIYGSSAIGGSIHLNNTLSFRKEFANSLQLRYGSFDTFNGDYVLKASTEKFSSRVAVSRNSSDNDYDYLGTNMKNENGQFYNTSLNIALGYQFNSRNQIKLYNEIFDGERHFSGTLAALSKSKYQDTNSRNLVEYTHFSNTTISTVKAAFLTESYKYFEDKNQPDHSYGKSETAVLKYDFIYKFSNDMQLNALADYTRTKGFGSDIGTNKREIGSGVVLFKHQLTQRFLYEANIRKEVTSNYESPFLYALGTQYKITDYFTSKLNFSRNFRIPTFNDLYWQQGGNPDLKPESAYQFECINEFNYKSFRFSITGFYNKIKDMISWVPNQNGLWQPMNTNRVMTYGLETGLIYDKGVSTNQHLKLAISYAYTVSENEATGKQLIYAPQHKLTSGMAYNYKRMTFYANHLFNGSVYTSLDNAYFLKEYNVVDIGLEYQIIKQAKLGFQVHNLLNENYQVMLQRPFPGRNYTVNFNLNL